MKHIRWQKHIYWFLAAWFGSLMLVMLYTSFFYDKPSFQDFIGFGGLLLVACIVLIPFFYTPLLWGYKKLHLPPVWWLRILILVFIGNIPVYLLLLMQYESRMSTPEAKLFLAGYSAIAIIYGLLYRQKMQ
ncbi:MAG: hypothetical protein ICV84_03865 [Flavisolibacter sp.]|nr:hypothetical protein [Flavisolibacter sp.]